MSPSLWIARLHPDRARLARWVAATGERALQDDLGYALHAVLSATLGALAPRPFVWREHGGEAELIGYVHATSDEIDRALSLPPADDAAAAAVGLRSAVFRPMPVSWRRSERLSFEVRVVPMVRSRAVAPGSVVEVDAAYHGSMAGDALGDRMAAYTQWLSRELGRGGAATLVDWREQAFSLMPVARRAVVDGQPGARAARRGHVPSLMARGELTVSDGEAFTALLRRGLGRHRAFGYGCLLVALPGVYF